MGPGGRQVAVGCFPPGWWRQSPKADGCSDAMSWFSPGDAVGNPVANAQIDRRNLKHLKRTPW